MPRKSNGISSMVYGTSDGTSGIVPGTSNGTSGIVLDTSDGSSGIVPCNFNGTSGIVPSTSNGTCSSVPGTSNGISAIVPCTLNGNSGIVLHSLANNRDIFTLYSSHVKQEEGQKTESPRLVLPSCEWVPNRHNGTNGDAQISAEENCFWETVTGNQFITNPGRRDQF